MNEEQCWIDAQIADSRRELTTSLEQVKTRAPSALEAFVKRRPFLATGIAAGLGYAAVGLGGRVASSGAAGGRRVPWSTLALRGTRLIGTLLPGLVGASAIAKHGEAADSQTN